MGKMQKTILKCLKDGLVVNFERFPWKTAARIIKEYKDAFLPDDFSKPFFKDYKNADCIRIIGTPNGYEDGNEKILAEYTPEEFFKAITREEASYDTVSII